MKLSLSVLFTIVFLASSLARAEVVALADGRFAEVTDWSAWSEIEIPSAVGSDRFVSAITKLSFVVPEGMQQGQTYLSPNEQTSVRLILAMDGRIGWLGPAEATLIQVAGRVYGVMLLGKGIRVLSGPSNPPASLTTDPRLEALGIIAQDPGSLTFEGMHSSIFSLTDIFGIETLRNGNSSQPNPGFISLLELRHEGVEVVAELVSLNDKRLRLHFSDTWNVTSGTVDGQNVMIVKNPRLPSRLPGWSFPKPFGYVVNGQIGNGRSFGKNLVATNSLGDLVSRRIRVVVTENGFVWTGPDNCFLAETGQAVFGLRLSSKNVLEIYQGWNGRYSGTPEDLAELENELLSIETEFKRTKALPLPQSSFALVEIFDTKPAFSAEEVVMGPLSYTDNLLTFEGQSYGPRGLFCITLDNTMSIIRANYFQDTSF